MEEDIRNQWLKDRYYKYIDGYKNDYEYDDHYEFYDYYQKKIKRMQQNTGKAKNPPASPKPPVRKTIKVSRCVGGLLASKLNEE